MPRNWPIALVAAATLAALLPTSAAATPAVHTPVVVHVGQIDSQDIPPLPGSEPDTLVEPDVAVSPVNPLIAVAAAHDGRYPDGGAVDISYAWTHDGGATWHHAPLPGVTKSAGGTWDRASDPVIAFGPDGSVYISVLAISLDCPSAVTVSRSTDGGKTFGNPVIAHYSATCDYSDDKNFLVIDNGANSPHLGRLYQFWTPFITDASGDSSQQVVRWSDDHGQTWSETVNLTHNNHFSQNSQPMIMPNGTIVDTYLDFGTAAGGEGPESRIGQDEAVRATPLADPPPADTMLARTSHDGGATWSAPSTVTTAAGEGPVGIRCCLPSAAADPVTGRLWVVWISPNSDTVMLSQSYDGTHWRLATRVTIPRAGVDYSNVDVAAYGGQVFIANALHRAPTAQGNFVQQQLSVTTDGRHFAPPIKLGPPSDLTYAAQARGIFPGDYMGTAATHGRVYSVWAHSSKPATAGALFHQVLFGATLKT